MFSWSNCSWESAWLDAHAAGDTATEAAATVVLDQIPDWPIVPIIDGDGGLTASVRRITDAAAAGDPAQIQADTALHCDPTIAR